MSLTSPFIVLPLTWSYSLTMLSWILRAYFLHLTIRSPTQRAAYNAHRRELYHKQGEEARKRRRERERDRYNALEGERKAERNKKRAKLERDRYNRLSKEELAERNRKRRERARERKLAKARDEGVDGSGGGKKKKGASKTEENVPGLPGMKMDEIAMDAMSDAVIADAVSAAAEVAEQVIASHDVTEVAMEVVGTEEGEESEDENGEMVDV